MSLVTTAFSLIGPGYVEKWIERPIGKEVVLVESPDAQRISFEELRERFALIGMVQQQSGDWHSSDGLVSISPLVDGAAVQALNVALNFSSDRDPRTPWSPIWEQLSLLKFACLGDGALTNIEERISTSLAFELWNNSRKLSPPPV
jgi:hypothetical protein